jgi:hypothetical protein
MSMVLPFGHSDAKPVVSLSVKYLVAMLADNPQIEGFLLL